MGWKKIKDHYEIDSLVHVEDGCVIIGSGYVPRVIQIHPDGKITNDSGLHIKKFRDLDERLRANPDELVRLMKEEDVFERSLPVYTWKDGKIIECYCENYEWPNTTHDGQIMYENVFFPVRADAVQGAIRSAQANIETAREHIDEFKKKLAQAEARLAKVTREYDQYRIEASASSRQA